MTNSKGQQTDSQENQMMIHDGLGVMHRGGGHATISRVLELALGLGLELRLE